MYIYIYLLGDLSLSTPNACCSCCTAAVTLVIFLSPILLKIGRYGFSGSGIPKKWVSSQNSEALQFYTRFIGNALNDEM